MQGYNSWNWNPIFYLVEFIEVYSHPQWSISNEPWSCSGQFHKRNEDRKLTTIHISLKSWRVTLIIVKSLGCNIVYDLLSQTVSGGLGMTYTWQCRVWLHWLRHYSGLIQTTKCTHCNYTFRNQRNDHQVKSTDEEDAVWPRRRLGLHSLLGCHVS